MAEADLGCVQEKMKMVIFQGNLKAYLKFINLSFWFIFLKNRMFYEVSMLFFVRRKYLN